MVRVREVFVGVGDEALVVTIHHCRVPGRERVKGSVLEEKASTGEHAIAFSSIRTGFESRGWTETRDEMVTGGGRKDPTKRGFVRGRAIANKDETLRGEGVVDLIV